MAIEQAVTLGIEYFPDPAKGRPLFNSNIYIGVVDLDPEIEANRITVTVIQENGTRVSILPSAQPLLTGSGGVIIYMGSPVSVVVDVNYSIKATNSLGAQVYYVPFVQNDAVALAELTTTNYDSIASMVADSGLVAGSQVTTTAYNSGWAAMSAYPKGGGLYNIVTSAEFTAITGGAPDEIYHHTLAGGDIALLDHRGVVSVTQGGATGDGVTLDVAAIQGAFDLFALWTSDARPEIQGEANDTYNISSTTLTIPKSGYIMRGYGAVILYNGLDTALRTGTPGATRRDITIKDFTFETNSASGTVVNGLLDFRGLTRLFLERVRCRTNGNDAVHLGTNTAGDGSIENNFYQCHFNMEINGLGRGIFMDSNVMTTLACRDCIFTYGSSQILLANTGGSAASTLIDHCVLELGDICIEVPSATVDNLSIENCYGEFYDLAFIKSKSPYRWVNNRQSSPGLLIQDLTDYLPDIRISNQDEFAGGIFPVPNFPAANRAINSDLAIWGDDNGSDRVPFGLTVQAFASVAWTRTEGPTTDPADPLPITGKYALKVVTTATNRDMFEVVNNVELVENMIGKRVYMCAWIYTDTASSVALRITDDAGSSASIVPFTHPGDGEWHYMVASRIIDASATFVNFGWRNSVAATTYYVSNYMRSLGEPVSLWPTLADRDKNYRIVETVTSIDLSGGIVESLIRHNNTGNDLYLNKVTLLYTEATSADAGSLLELGTETNDDFFFTGTSDIGLAKYATVVLTLLKRVLVDGNTLIFKSNGKTGIGEVKVIVEYLTV